MKNTNHAPRYFADGYDSWQWRNGQMTINHGEESIFTSPAELLAHGIFETDEDGNLLKPSADDIAGERGDREYRCQKEDEA